ncbi:MAG: hypothetical protein H0W73_17530 [Bacteroidetes bacterium]|nr:hypothetical protein [Bacteroidota bacterium]
MKSKHAILAITTTCVLTFTSCTRTGPTTEPSPNMGHESAEGGTSPDVSNVQDSLKNNRSGDTPK